MFQRTIPAETLVYESVSGLEVGAAVKYRGVPIGKVTGIIFSVVKYRETATLDYKSRGKDMRGILIEMSLSESALPNQDDKHIVETVHQMVENGLRARVTPAGISGQSFIDCDILNPADYPPVAISWKPDILYVPSAPSSVGQVLDAVQDIATNLKKADLGGLARHVDEVVMQAKTTIVNVNGIMDDNRDHINKTIAELPNTAMNLRNTLATADQILHDPRVDKVLGSLSVASESAQTALVDIRNLAHDAEQLLSGETEDVRSILADFRRLAADGAAITDDARQNPSRLFFGKPPEPHFVRPALGQ